MATAAPSKCISNKILSCNANWSPVGVNKDLVKHNIGENVQHIHTQVNKCGREAEGKAVKS